MATSLASAPARVKNALDRPGGVTRASVSPTSARTAETMNGDMNETRSICSLTAAPTRGSPWPMFTHMAIELKSMYRVPSTPYR